MPSATPVLPKTQTAVVGSEDREFCIVHDLPVIECEDDMVIIKTHAVALNPVDTKLHDDMVTPGVSFGFDCAGTIVAVGSKVKREIHIGDRVCGAACGMDKTRPSGGAFTEYAALGGDLLLKIPDDMSFEDACTMGTALNSTAMVLFHSFGLPWTLVEKPSEKAFPVLVYGGSSAVGTMAIQILRICGLRPLAICSEKNFDLVKSYGAEECWDYHSETCAADIKKYTKNSLAYTIDCITTESSMKICYEAMGRAGGKYCALDPFPPTGMTRKVVKPDWIIAFRVTGRPCLWPEPFYQEADPGMLEYSHPFYITMEKYFLAGKLKTHPTKVMQGGFPALLEGVGMLRRKEISGQKLVFPIVN